MVDRAKNLISLALLSLIFIFLSFWIIPCAAAADGTFYLSFPLSGYTAYDAAISSVMDHSMNNPYINLNRIVTAYTGETGDYLSIEGCYNRSNGERFYVNNHYTGAHCCGNIYYMCYDGHPGIDYPTSNNTPVHAAADGVAYHPSSFPGVRDAQLYNTVEVDHQNGYKTYYLHLSNQVVSDGSLVTRGQIIGYSGDKGSPGAYHLHFEVQKNGVPVDPYGWTGNGPDPYTRATNIELWTPSSTRSGFDSFILPGNDDGSTGLVPIGFPVNFFGTIYDHLYVNNNGNLTFDSRLATYTPFPLQTTNRVIIAPFFADVDTRVGTIVKYGPGTMGGHPAFGVTWPGVGCYNTNIRVLNYFQVVLIDRSDTGAGDFDIEYNYDQIQWETGTASGGNSDCLFGSSARVGYSNGVNTSFELLGSGIPGSFLDSNPITGLVYNSRNSLQPGRYLFDVRNGIAPTGGTISGAIYADSAVPGNEVAGAFVQVCGTGGFCNTTTTGISGQYSVSGLQADSYNIRAFSPGGSTLEPGTSGPITVVGSETHAGQDIVLHAPPPPPPNPVSPAHSGGGTIVAYWHDPLTLSAHGCPNGTASYQVTVDDGLTLNGPMTETPAGSGTYIATIPPFFPNSGVAHIVYAINCSDGSSETVEFDIYIDPSGVVKTTSGDPIQGATVTLLRADTAAGPFVQVPNGSGIMSPSNRNNPDTTNAFGLFGWDVIAGFYKIRAEKSECHAPGNSGQLFVESTVLQVPPPATNLELFLECPWPSSLPGDLNGDGIINTADYTIFRSTLGKCSGTTGFIPEADYDGDGCVTYADYRIWYGYYKNQ